MDWSYKVAYTFVTIWILGMDTVLSHNVDDLLKNVPSIPDSYIINKKSKMRWEWFNLISLSFQAELMRNKNWNNTEVFKIFLYLHLIDVTMCLCHTIILALPCRQKFSHSYGQFCCWTSRRTGNIPFSIWILEKYHEALIKLSDFVAYSRVNHILIWSALEKLLAVRFLHTEYTFGGYYAEYTPRFRPFIFAYYLSVDMHNLLSLGTGT